MHVESELSQVLHSTGSYDAASKLEYVVAEQNQMEYKLSLASVYHSGKFFFLQEVEWTLQNIHGLFANITAGVTGT